MRGDFCFLLHRNFSKGDRVQTEVAGLYVASCHNIVSSAAKVILVPQCTQHTVKQRWIETDEVLG